VNVSASFEHEGRRLWAWAVVRLGSVSPAGVLPATFERIEVTDTSLARVEPTPEMQRAAAAALRAEADRRIVRPDDHKGE
jgi:hypothetical protein